MTDPTGIQGDRIRSFIERVEHIDEEIKVLKEILRLRKLDKDERDEHESLVDLYLRAMEGAEPQEEAKAA
jgi:uncharacterized protein (UPF0335 family)